MNYVLYGEEQFRLKKTLQTIIKEYIADGDELNTVQYDALQCDLETILEDAMTIPFFSAYKIILVYHANFLSTANDTGIDPNGLENYVKQPMESTVLILIGDFAKLDTRKKIIKLIQKNWKVLEFRKLDDLGKQSCVKEEIQRRQLHVDAQAMQELLKRLPLDMETIHSAFDKLQLYGGDITQDVVAHLVARPLEEDVFELVNAVVEQDVRKAFRIWCDLCVVNTDAIYLIALLASQFRFLFEVKTLMMQWESKDGIKDILHAHPYRIKLAMQSVQNLSASYLMSMLAKLATLDQKLKGGLLDKKMGFEMFLLELQGA